MRWARALVIVAACLATIAAAQSPRRTIVFGGDAAYPPMEWMENGEARGFNVDLARAMGQLGDAEVVHRLGDWPDVIRALEAGEIDVVPMFRSQARESRFAFTSAFFYAHHSIYAGNAQAPAYRIDDLAAHTVAVEELSYAHQRIVDEGLGIDLVLFKNTLKALQAVEEGTVEYAVLAGHAADELVRTRRMDVRSFGSPFWPQEYAFAVRRDRPELIQWTRESLAEVMTTGRYEDIYARWGAGLRGNHVTFGEALRGLVYVVSVLLLLAAAGFGWSWTLRRRVAARTAEIEVELGKRRTAEYAATHAAEHDRLTGLPELPRYLDLVDRRLRDAHEDPDSAIREVMVMRLAQLDAIVTTFGVDVAEDYVSAFAARMRDIGYAVCGYLGRGVFAVYSDRMPTSGNLATLALPVVVQGIELHPELVGGSARWPAGGQVASELVRNAQTAMAVSATSRRSWTLYEPHMDPDPMDLRIVSDVRRSGVAGMFAVFQPQVSLPDRRVKGAEALVRWNHHELGFLPPMRFVPLLEKTGLITRVTEWMVTEALRAAAEVREWLPGFTVAVNVSSHDLMHQSFVDAVRHALERSDHDPSSLKVELTETSFADDPAGVEAALLALREIGISTAVDDFGTGYSSLSYLSRLSIDEVKIDREFVDGLPGSTRQQMIVRSTIALARELGMTTVAEGAEDEATLDMLTAFGCDAVQGYVIAKPMPLDDLKRFLEDL